MNRRTRKLSRPAGLVSRRRFLQGTGSALAGVTILSRRARAAEELNVLAWCDHADPKVLKPFEEAHNVRLNMKTYEGTGTAMGIVEQSRPGDWDVFVVDAQDGPRVGRTGVLAELNDDQMPWESIFPQLRQAPYTYVDGKLYVVPEKFGYYGVAYNSNRVDPTDMRSAQVMWNSKYTGRMAVYDYYVPALNLIAISLGLKPTDVTMDSMNQIRERALAMKSHVKLVGDIVGVQNALVNGDVDLIINAAEFAVSGLQTENPALNWVIFDEGGLMWNQGLAIFNDSKKKDLAIKFIDYLLTPHGQARLATSSCYWAMPANKNATLTGAQKKILRWDEQPDFLSRSYASTVNDEIINEAMLDVWNEFIQA